MKKWIAAALVLSMLFACVALAEQEPKPDDRLTYTVSEDGKTLTIDLTSNPTTGYLWSYTASAEGALVETVNEYLPETTDETVVGSGGIQRYAFTLAPEASGTVLLTFAEGRPWETEVSTTLELEMEIGAQGVFATVTLLPEKAAE